MEKNDTSNYGESLDSKEATSSNTIKVEEYYENENVDEEKYLVSNLGTVMNIVKSNIGNYFNILFITQRLLKFWKKT